MPVQLYAVNTMLIYLLIAISFDVFALLSGSPSPLFANSAFQAVPFMISVWGIIVFIKPFRTELKNEDKSLFRSRILHLAIMYLLIMVPAFNFLFFTKHQEPEHVAKSLLFLLSTIVHVGVFFLALYLATFSHPLINRLGQVTVFGGLKSFFSIFSQIIVLGGLILFGSLGLIVYLKNFF